MLAKRPESEEMVRENNNKADKNAVCGAVLSGYSTAEGNGDDGLGKVEEKVLHRDPENEPYDEYEGVSEDGGEERGSATGALEDIGEGGEGREGGEGGAGLGRDKGQNGEEKLNDGENSWREL